MLPLRRIFKNYEEAGSLSAEINLYGFIGPEVFLTKTGEVGVILEVDGVDYECLDGPVLDGLTKRLESALKLFDEKCTVYQYLFKRNNEPIPYRLYGNAVVDAAIKNRIAYLAGKADTLFRLSVYYVVLYRGFEATREIVSALQEFPRNSKRVFGAIISSLSSEKQVVVLGRQVSEAQATLLAKTRSFILQVRDFLGVRVLEKQEAFRVLKRTLNFDPRKITLAKLKYDTFLDYYLPESHLECHRSYLRVDDYHVKVLTLKEPPAQSFPLIFRHLLDVEASYHVVTEWRKEDSGRVRRSIQAMRRHYHNTRRSFLSQATLSDSPAQDPLLDDSKQSRVRELGEAVEQIELGGNYFGRFSLAVVIYDLDPAKVDGACAQFYKVFSLYDAQLYEERYNLLNAFLAAVPGNQAFNLRCLYLLNTNYADFSFLFTLHCGETRNHHLHGEYLAVLETNHHTPYFLNLHYRDVAHTMILGRTGAGKSFLLNFLITNLQKYRPQTFIFDLGGSFESLTRLFGGSYVRVGLDSGAFHINPFSLPPTKENLAFLTPGVLANTLGHDLRSRLAKWTHDGQFAFLFDGPDDTVSFSRFQCFDFQRMSQYAELLEPLLFYILHRANAVITDRTLAPVFKAFFIDEAWVFLRNPRIERYIVEALKTWRKHNAALVLSTQSLDELRRSQILDIIIESCATKIFLANPDMDRELYQQQFHLNEKEVELVANLIPKQQFLIKTPDRAKVANLHVDPKSYWLYTNDPYDNKKRDQAFEVHGLERGLEVLAATPPLSQQTEVISIPNRSLP